MLEQRLAEMFKERDPVVQKLLREVLRLEQQYITDPLRTNSGVLREIRQKIDRLIEEMSRNEA